MAKNLLKTSSLLSTQGTNKILLFFIFQDRTMSSSERKTIFFIFKMINLLTIISSDAGPMEVNDKDFRYISYQGMSIFLYTLGNPVVLKTMQELLQGQSHFI